MNVFDKSSLMRIFGDVGTSPDWEDWWSEGVFWALHEEALELQIDNGDLALDTTTTE